MILALAILASTRSILPPVAGVVVGASCAEGGVRGIAGWGVSCLALLMDSAISSTVAPALMASFKVASSALPCFVALGLPIKLSLPSGVTVSCTPPSGCIRFWSFIAFNHLSLVVGASSSLTLTGVTVPLGFSSNASRNMDSVSIDSDGTAVRPDGGVGGVTGGAGGVTDGGTDGAGGAGGWAGNSSPLAP